MSNNVDNPENLEGQMDNEEEGEEVFDDDYLLALHKYLQEKKKQRKQAEQDVNLLDGRLRCLRDEQRKEDFKIAVTRKKTEKKRAQIDIQQEEMRKKMEFRNMKDKELELKRQQNKMQKEQNRQAIQMKKDERKRQVEEDAKMMKDAKKSNYELKKYMEIEDTSNKKTQAEYIKSQQIIAEEKRRAVELEKKNRIKEELERKIQEEEEKILDCNNRKQNLEEEEIVIMNKLKRTTQMHENLERDLENLSNSKKDSAAGFK